MLLRLNGDNNVFDVVVFNYVLTKSIQELALNVIRVRFMVLGSNNYSNNVVSINNFTIIICIVKKVKMCV